MSRAVKASPRRDGLRLRFILAEDGTAMTWSLYAGSHGVDAYALHLHAPTQLKDWWMGPDECDVLPGGQCWGNGGGLIAERVLAAFLADGEDGAWAAMASIRNEWLEPDEMPA